MRKPSVTTLVFVGKGRIEMEKSLTPGHVFLFVLPLGRPLCRRRVLTSKRSPPDTTYGLMLGAAPFQASHYPKVPTPP